MSSVEAIHEVVASLPRYLRNTPVNLGHLVGDENIAEVEICSNREDGQYVYLFCKIKVDATDKVAANHHMRFSVGNGGLIMEWESWVHSGAWRRTGFNNSLANAITVAVGKLVLAGLTSPRQHLESVGAVLVDVPEGEWNVF